MAIKKIKLPNNTTVEVNDSRVVSDAIVYAGSAQGTATYVDDGQPIDVSTKADKVSNATNGNFAGLDANGNLTDSGHKHSDYQAALVSGTNIKTINNQSLLGSGNITALTSETDPVFTASAAHGISSTDISNWNAKQKAITVSSSEPTGSQGANGDIWIVI